MHILLSYDESNPNCPSDVEIPTTVWFIGQYAFYGTDITSVALTEYTLGIESEAFSETNSLTSIDFSDHINTIGDSAFAGSALESITIPDSVIHIGDYAFSRSNLTSVTLGSGLSMPGSYIFSQNHLTSITLPSTMTTIPTGMFHSNNFTSLTIPSTVTTIGDAAFTSNQLTSLTIPNSVTSIGANAFSWNEMTSLTVPDSVTTIGAGAFSRNMLTGIDLGEGVTTIGSNAFAYNSITDVDVPDSVTTIQPNAFSFQSAINKAMVFLVPANQVQALYDQIWYVRLYTEDAANPKGLTDSIVYEQSALLSDADGDGTNDSAGGHIINPAVVTVSYEDTDGAPVSNVEVLTGTGLSTYKVVENVGNDLGRYYRLGSSLTVDALPIDGYEQPDSYTMVLGAGVNQHTFLYTATTPPVDPPVVVDPPVIGNPQTPPADEEKDDATQEQIVLTQPGTNNQITTEQIEDAPRVTDTSTDQEDQPPLPLTAPVEEKQQVNLWIPSIVLAVVGFVIVFLIARRRQRQ